MNRFKESTNTNANKNQKAMDRMHLMSMVPIETDPAHSSPQKQTALDKSYETCQKTLSNFSSILEYSSKDDQLYKSLDHPIAMPSHHKVTSYTPKLYIAPEYSPEPASYFPIYNAVKPSVKGGTIGNIPSLPHSQKTKQTTPNILQTFNTNIRSFNPSTIENSEDQLPPLETEHEFGKSDLNKGISFDKQISRKEFLVEKPQYPEKSFFVPPIEKPKVISFAEQKERPSPFKGVEGPDYSDKAIEQADKLRLKNKAPFLDKQISRNYIAPKNERVAFLERIASEQQNMLNSLKLDKMRARSANSYSFSSSSNGDETKPKLKETFSMQRGRDNILVSQTESSKPSRYHYDPLKSLKAIWPKTHVATIGTKKEFNGPAFWGV